MNRFAAGFLSNDSFFGRIMTKIAIVVGANLIFLVFCIPVVTIGPAICALYYVMLETLYGTGTLNPFKVFWKGFRMNLKQGILTWLIFLVIAVLAYFDIRFSKWAGGIFSAFLIAVYVVLAAAVILYSYLYPVMASFQGSIRDMFTNSIYFAFRKPLRMILLIGVEAGAFFLTYFNLDLLPLWAFCWFFFGFGAIAMLGAKLLLPLFKPYLQPERSTVQPEEQTAAQKSAPDPVPEKAAMDAESMVQKKEEPSAADEEELKKIRRQMNAELNEEMRDNELRLSDDDWDSMEELKKMDGV